MILLLSILILPLLPARAYIDEYDESESSGLGIVYLLTVSFGLGIWLVVQRYHKKHNRPVPFEVNAPVPADPGWEGLRLDEPTIRSHLDQPQILSHINLPGQDYITAFDPATGMHIGTYIADDEREIRRKIRLAKKAQAEQWRFTDFTQRRRVMRSLLKWLVDHQDVCARVACRDTGKTLIDASLGEILTTCAKLEWLINYGEKYLRPETRHGNFMLSYKKSQVHYDPLGVVAGIVSWNYPLHNAWSPILAGIFAGNAVILKCHENVIWSSTYFISVIQDCLKACGHNPDLVQIICCYPERADALSRSPDIRHITFIGSETVGRKIALAATEHLIPVTMELGGKDPAIILPGTDLEKVGSILMRGIFQNMGQNCVGIERVIVHESQYDDLQEMLASRIEKLRPGSVLAPTPEGYVTTVDCGSMIAKDRFQNLEQMLTDATEAGANLIGGQTYIPTQSNLTKGFYFAPTLVGPVYSNMEVAQQEVFAPIAILMPYETIDEAIEIANGTKYALGASVFGPIQKQCIEVAKELDCGMVSVNDFGVFYMNQDLPFGGTKASGYGRFGGPEGLRALTSPKAIIVDRWPSFIQTSIPKALDYPIKSLHISWEFASGLVQLLYADSFRAQFRGLATLVWAARKNA